MAVANSGSPSSDFRPAVLLPSTGSEKNLTKNHGLNRRGNPQPSGDGAGRPAPRQRARAAPFLMRLNVHSNCSPKFFQRFFLASVFSFLSPLGVACLGRVQPRRQFRRWGSEQKSPSAPEPPIRHGMALAGIGRVHRGARRPFQRGLRSGRRQERTAAEASPRGKCEVR